jgi:DNA-directed RNA polymerase subunit RPC12/RpoP
MVEQLCANCKWEVVAVVDHEGIARCSDCGSVIEGHNKSV